MELIVCVALGVWISLCGWVAYRSLANEFAGNNEETKPEGMTK